MIAGIASVKVHRTLNGSKMVVWIRSVLLGLLLASSAAFAQEFGSFNGELIFKWGRDGRTMTLTVPFGYIDPKGREWNVPAGAVTDGATIPQIFWVYAGPYEGNYRDAAVVHDYYCQTKTRAWRDTHLVFYNAMRAAGVSETQAKVLYGAVYYFGPRWGIGAGTRGPGGEKRLSKAEQKKFIEDLKSWVEQEKPSISQVENRLDTEGEPLRH